MRLPSEMPEKPKTPNLDKLIRSCNQPWECRTICAFLFRFSIICALLYIFYTSFYDNDFELDLYLRSNQTHIAVLDLTHFSQFHGKRCIPVTVAAEKEELKLAHSLIETAKHYNFSTLTPFHVNRRSCLIVTTELSGKFDILVNPHLASSSSPIRIKEHSILCRNAVNKEVSRRLSLHYNNVSVKSDRFHADCQTISCAFSLSHALDLLDGRFKC